MTHRLQTILRHLTASRDSEDLEAQKKRMSSRTVKGNDTITVTVTGCTQADTTIDAGMFDNDLHTFKVGPETKGLLQPALSIAVLGLRVGEENTFQITPADAAHPQATRDEKLVIVVPTGGAKVNLGATVRLQHEGQLRLATVIAFNEKEETATLDMNDPLAGKDLIYTVKINEMDTLIDLTVQLFPEPVGVPNKIFTLKDLHAYNGKNGTSIYVGVNGYVFDMSSGKKFYGPDGMYGFMAGHDSTCPRVVPKSLLYQSAKN